MRIRLEKDLLVWLAITSGGLPAAMIESLGRNLARLNPRDTRGKSKRKIDHAQHRPTHPTTSPTRRAPGHDALSGSRVAAAMRPGNNDDHGMKNRFDDRRAQSFSTALGTITIVRAYQL